MNPQVDDKTASTVPPELTSVMAISAEGVGERFAGISGEYERRLAEKEQLAARLESLLKGLPAGVVVLDGTGTIQQANAAAEALLGAPLEGLRWRDVIERSFASRPQAGCDLKLADGRLVSLATCPLEGEPGQILLLNDVTETRALQERASRDQRLMSMGRMVASLAHQIRTPLSSALLYASHMKRPGLEEERRIQLAEKILGRIRHLEQLLNDMLLFAHGGLGGGEQLTATELLQALREAVEIQLRAHGTRLILDDKSRGQMVRCNRELLLSALQNLVTNAIQAMGDGGIITLGAHLQNEDRLVISVADNGPGIPPQLQQKIFEPFVTTRGSGTGLGLAVARSVAQLHRGDLEMESVVGEGTLFRMHLPVVGQERRRGGRNWKSAEHPDSSTVG